MDERRRVWPAVFTAAFFFFRAEDAPGAADMGGARFGWRRHRGR